MKIEHNEARSSRAYDDDIVELWITLPSGKRLYFREFTPDEFGDLAAEIKKRKAEIVETLHELVIADMGGLL